MDFENIVLKKEDHVATLILNRPEVFNALNMKMFQEIKEALQDVNEDENIRVMVLTGAGKALKDIKSDSPKPADTVSVDAGLDDSVDDSNLTVEERAKKNWDAKADLRAEYGTYERYESFLKHSPDIRVKTDR